MPTVISGIEHKSKSRLHVLAPILAAWGNLIYRYGEVWNWKDVPYWWNERASVSTLAAAAWVAGGIALEEYRTEKGDAQAESSVGKGRGDLYLSLGDQHFIVEAKQHWARTQRTLTETVAASRSWLDQACTEVRAKRAYGCPGEPHRKQRRLGIVFVVPALLATAQADLDVHLEQWLSALRELPVDSMCWCFAPPEHSAKSKDGLFYPGVCLLLREVHPGSQAERTEELYRI